MATGSNHDFFLVLTIAIYDKFEKEKIQNRWLLDEGENPFKNDYSLQLLTHPRLLSESFTFTTTTTTFYIEKQVVLSNELLGY